MTISKKNKECLVKFHDNICEQCHEKKEFEELQIHKINPVLGYSNHRNLKVVCYDCHDLYSSADRKARGIQ